MKSFKLIALASAGALGFVAAPAGASTCVGNCGTSGADGDIDLSPTGNSTYNWISTSGGAGQSDVGEIAGVGDGDDGFNTGSEFISNSFTAAAGDELTFFFNYVTSDGSGFADYGWASLVDGTGSVAAWLFTGRTRPEGDIAPGFGLPALDATLTPATSAIIGGAPNWSPLGASSGTCFAAGCGYTGWIESSYTIATAGTYTVQYGVTNFNDSSYQSGLAFDGLALNDVEIGGAVPEPSTWALLLLGFFGIGGMMRRRGEVRSTKVTFA